MSSKIVGSTIVALVVMQAGAAHAQAPSSDAAIAQSLFDEGRKLMAEKKYPEACPRLERSYKLDPAAGTLLNLAVCHEAEGRTATAWDEFRDSVAMARRENREERMKFAQAHVDALKARLCHAHGQAVRAGAGGSSGSSTAPTWAPSRSASRSPSIPAATPWKRWRPKKPWRTTSLTARTANAGHRIPRARGSPARGGGRTPD